MISLRSSTRTSTNLLRLSSSSSLRLYAVATPTQSTALEGQAVNPALVPGGGGGAIQREGVAQQLSPRELAYPHVRAAPRLTPVVPLGSAPIPGGGRWSGVQTGSLGQLLPPPGTPEGKPGVIGMGIYKGTEWDLLKYEFTEKGLHWKVPILMFIPPVLLFYLFYVDKPLLGPPPKPAGNYSIEEDRVRDAAYRIRLAEIAAREKAAQLHAEAIAAEKSLASTLDSAKDEVRERVEDLGERMLSSTGSQLQVLSEKFQDLKTKTA